MTNPDLVNEISADLRDYRAACLTILWARDDLNEAATRLDRERARDMLAAAQDAERSLRARLEASGALPQATTERPFATTPPTRSSGREQIVGGYQV